MPTPAEHLETLRLLKSVITKAEKIRKGTISSKQTREAVADDLLTLASTATLNVYDALEYVMGLLERVVLPEKGEQFDFDDGGRCVYCRAKQGLEAEDAVCRNPSCPAVQSRAVVAAFKGGA